jgi:argininosuccinate synthase
MKKVVLAYSGGLDTTFCALYLKEQGFEVHAISIQTGGFSPEELAQIEQKAVALGVASFKIKDVTTSYYDDCIRYLIYGNVLKNNTYPLSVSAERMVQAIAVAEYVRETGAGFVAHGSTGAGNDQVRFDIVFQGMIPEVQIITPIRDLQLSREEEVKYLIERGVQLDFQKSKYSINKGLWGTSVGGVETLSSKGTLPEEAWPTPVSEFKERVLTLEFKEGQFVGIDGRHFAHPVEAIKELQAIAVPYGIGRDIHVGDTIIGLKGRVGFEAAAPMIIIKAHHLLEKHVLTKWQLYWKDQLSVWYGNFLHEGLMLEPSMRNIEAFLQDTQTRVSGTVQISLFPYRFQLNGVDAAYDLMGEQHGTYGETSGAWCGEDVRSFAKIFGNQIRMYQSTNQE